MEPVPAEALPRPTRARAKRLLRVLTDHPRVVVHLLVFCLAFTLYQAQVDHPPQLVSDETFYVKVARNITNGVYFEESDQGPRPENYVHPPLAKLLIAASLLIHGKPGNDYIHEPDPAAANGNYVYGTSGDACGYYNPDCADDARAWRFAITLFGALGVLAASVLAAQLFNRLLAGAAAALLLLLDNLYYLQSRIANLEVFAAALTLGALAFALARVRGAKILAGILFGAAVATKYNALFLLPALALFVFLRTSPPKRAGALAWLQRGGTTLVHALLLPAVVYVASHALFLHAWADLGGWGYAWGQWWTLQVAALNFHQTVTFHHVDASPPLLWIPMVRPVGFWARWFPDGLVYVWALGNPFLWWTATLALIVVPARILGRRLRSPEARRRLAQWLRGLVHHDFQYGRDLYVLLAAFLFWAAYLPFFLLDRPMFLYYMGFLVPFFALFAGGLIAEAWHRGGRHRNLAALYLVLTFVTFLWYLPIVAGIPLDPRWHGAIMDTIPWMAER